MGIYLPIELKHRMNEFYHTGSSHLQKFSQEPSHGKVTLIVAYNCEGVILTHAVPQGRAVNRELIFNSSIVSSVSGYVAQTCMFIVRHSIYLTDWQCLLSFCTHCNQCIVTMQLGSLKHPRNSADITRVTSTCFLKNPSEASDILI